LFLSGSSRSSFFNNLHALLINRQQVLFKTAAEFLKRNAQGEHDNDSVGMLFGSYLLDLVVQAAVSPIVGIVFAGTMGLAFKIMDFRQHPMLEMSLYVLPIYIPFILSEVLDLSGMITIFFTGIFARRYMEPNVSSSTREYSLALFQLLSFLAETCIFLELGLSVFGLHKSFYFPFIGWAFVAALLGRALSVYPLSTLFNFSLTRPVSVCGTDACATNVDDDITTAAASNYYNNGNKSSDSPNKTSMFVMDDDLKAAMDYKDSTTTAAAATAAVADGDAKSSDIEENIAQTSTSTPFFSIFKMNNGVDMMVTPHTGNEINNNAGAAAVGAAAPYVITDYVAANVAFAPTTTEDGDNASIASSSKVAYLGGDEFGGEECEGGSVATNTTSTSLLISPRETPLRKRDKIIPIRFQHVLWFAGLRGAVAYACAREFPDVYG
jgi:Sodium/hydrogen exchanger family